MRKIPAALRAHLQQPVTTTCRLLKFTLSDGRTFGITTLDVGLTYEGTVYSAVNGFNTSVIASDTGLSVDNAEALALLSATPQGITAGMVVAGELDNAQWRMLLVNYRDLSMGHVVIDGGDVGQVALQDGMAYMPELLSYAMRLRQSIGHYDSRTCRAIFGSEPNTQTGCGVDANALWETHTVTGVGDERRLVFSASGLIGHAENLVPGRIRWVTGDNASVRLSQTEAFGDGTGTVSMFESLAFDIQLGDRFQIRPDCTKLPAQCTAYGNFLNYKGEPLIPVGDGVEVLTPNSQMPGGFVGPEVIE